MKAFILVLTMTFSTICFALGPGVGGGGGLKTNNDITIINGEAFLPASVVANHAIFMQLIQKFRDNEIEYLEDGSAVIRDVEEIEFNNGDIITSIELEEEEAITASIVDIQHVNLFNGIQIEMEAAHYDAIQYSEYR